MFPTALQFFSVQIPMVKPAFANLEIDLWVHHGILGVSHCSLCLFHDTVQLGSPILDALGELKSETYPARRLLILSSQPRKWALTKLRLMIVPTRDELKVMSIQHEKDVATIEMTDEGHRVLTEAFAAWFGGAEDFGVCPRHSTIRPRDLGKLDRESCELWFWGPYYWAP